MLANSSLNSSIGVRCLARGLKGHESGTSTSDDASTAGCDFSVPLVSGDEIELLETRLPAVRRVVALTE